MNRSAESCELTITLFGAKWDACVEFNATHVDSEPDVGIVEGWDVNVTDVRIRPENEHGCGVGNYHRVNHEELPEDVQTRIREECESSLSAPDEGDWE